MVNCMYYEISRYLVHPESRRNNYVSVLFCDCPQPGTYETLDERERAAVSATYQKIGMYTRYQGCMLMYVRACVRACVSACVHV